MLSITNFPAMPPKKNKHDNKKKKCDEKEEENLTKKKQNVMRRKKKKGQKKGKHGQWDSGQWASDSRNGLGRREGRAMTPQGPNDLNLWGCG